MHDRYDPDLPALLIDRVDNDVRRLDQLPCARYQSGASDVSKAGRPERFEPRLDASNHLVRGTWIIIRDPREDAVEVVTRRRVENDLHSPLG
jgi:hypothetical protein